MDGHAKQRRQKSIEELLAEAKRKGEKRGHLTTGTLGKTYQLLYIRGWGIERIREAVKKIPETHKTTGAGRKPHPIDEELLNHTYQDLEASAKEALRELLRWVAENNHPSFDSLAARGEHVPRAVIEHFGNILAGARKTKEYFQSAGQGLLLNRVDHYLERAENQKITPRTAPALPGGAYEAWHVSHDPDMAMPGKPTSYTRNEIYDLFFSATPEQRREDKEWTANQRERPRRKETNEHRPHHDTVNGKKHPHGQTPMRIDEDKLEEALKTGNTTLLMTDDADRGYTSSEKREWIADVYARHDRNVVDKLSELIEFIQAEEDFSPKKFYLHRKKTYDVLAREFGSLNNAYKQTLLFFNEFYEHHDWPKMQAVCEYGFAKFKPSDIDETDIAKYFSERTI